MCKTRAQQMLRKTDSEKGSLLLQVSLGKDAVLHTEDDQSRRMIRICSVLLARCKDFYVFLVSRGLKISSVSYIRMYTICFSVTSSSQGISTRL